MHIFRDPLLLSQSPARYRYRHTGRQYDISAYATERGSDYLPTLRADTRYLMADSHHELLEPNDALSIYGSPRRRERVASQIM